MTQSQKPPQALPETPPDAPAVDKPPAYSPLDAAPPETGNDEGGQAGERIAKALARAGVASRREVERLIESGRIAINGRIVETPATRVGPDDILTFDSEVVDAAEATRVFRYHKPVGQVTTHADPKGRPTVFETLPEGLPRVISIGRLDINSEGLLLLTNDGSLSRALELPSTGWVRQYRARAYGEATQAKLDTLKTGVTVEGVRYGPIEARLDKVNGRNCWITVSLSEGKNREVRRVLESIGLKVNRLIRLAYGPFALSILAPGEVEEVGPRVIRELLADHIAPANLPTGHAVQYRTKSNAERKRRQALAESQSGDSQIDAALVQAPIERPAKPVRKAGWAKAKPRSPAAIAAKKANQRATAKYEERKARYAASPDGAKVKPSGSPRREELQTSKPVARSGPSAPRQTSGARPPGPRPAGGPKRRG